jgi:hypothetical protein
MRKLLLILIAVIQLVGCIPIKGQKLVDHDMAGVYKRQESSKKLEIKSDGSYILWNAEILFIPVIEQCDYASKGKWSVIAENVIEITSDNYYMEQKGFKYEINKEKKLSQDSLYIEVVFPTDFHPVKLDFTFNHNNNKSITTDKTYIVVPKSKYLWDKRTATNQISFSLNADVSGTELYKSRILFKIFEDYIDTEKFNFLTINLLNFDRCFFEFEPYNHELIYIKDRNQIFWEGGIWKR